MLPSSPNAPMDCFIEKASKKGESKRERDYNANQRSY